MVERLTAKRSWLRAMTGSARADNEAYAEGLKSGLLGLTRSSNGLSPRIQSGKDLNTLLCCRNQQLQLNISPEKRILCLTGAPLRRASLFATRDRWPSYV